MEKQKQTAPFTLGLALSTCGHDVTRISMRTSLPLVPEDSRTLLDMLLCAILPESFPRRFTYEGDVIVFGSKTDLASPSTCCPSGVVVCPISLVMELPDGSVCPVTISLTKVAGLRGDYLAGDCRYVRFVGTITVEVQADVTE